jgi:hypothetical protein
VNTVDDLLRSLERHTRLAPDGAGMVEQARLGAARIRRHRRVATTVAAAAAILLVAVGVPLMAHHRTVPATPAPVRSAAEMSIGLAAGSGFTVQQRAADGARQLIVARATGTSPAYEFSADVWAYDPGAFDPASLPPGETVRVGDHDARLVPALSKERLEFLTSIGGFPSGPQPSGTPDGTVNTDVEAAVVWQDPSGIWLTVSRAENRDTLLRLAAAVRVVAASLPRGPLGLSWLPDRLAVTHAETMEMFPGMFADIVLTVPEPDTNVVPAQSAVSTGPGTTRVEIHVEDRGFNQWNDGMKLPAPTLTVAGYPAWYFQGAADGYTFGAAEGRLLIETDTCGIRVRAADVSAVGRDELLRMMNLASYGSCTSMTDWIPVVS